MLTKESSHGFCPHESYPTYEYRSKMGNRIKAKCGGGRILPKPKGYTEVIRLKNIDEDFAHYLEWIQDDHRKIPDSKFIEHPYGIFIGAWRNARWQDEAQRRGLTK